MKIRMLFLALAIPCLMIGCGTESEPEDNSLRGNQVDPCTPDDCIPLAPALEDQCGPGFESVGGAECVDSNGECVWEFWDSCVPTEVGGNDDPPPPSEGPVRPRTPA